MWPVTLHGESVELRPPRMRDKRQWNSVRAENKEWLAPWEATIPEVADGMPASEFLAKGSSFTAMVRALNREARAVRSYSFMVWQNENLIGQITLGGVIYGALRGGHIGYWIDRNFANRGLTTDAVKTLTRFAFESLGLHRLEINVRPENEASCRVALKAGYFYEGDRAAFLHISGQWRDHKCFVKSNELVK